VPNVRRSRILGAPPERVWRTVGDPQHLPRWWPKVERVEQVEGDRFTELLRTQKGRAVRADFRVLESEDARRRRWEQDLPGSPFERILRSAVTTVELEPRDDGGTLVRLSLDQRLRGLARFGGFLVRVATRRQLDEALDALEGLHGA
jgi:uncharacterized protein YndB with AHSA1/START domain